MAYLPITGEKEVLTIEVANHSPVVVYHSRVAIELINGGHLFMPYDAITGAANQPAALQPGDSIDIAIGVKRSSDCSQCIAPLEGLGYGYIGDRGERGGHIFAKEDRDILTHALHLLEFQCPQWRNYLAFREYLRASREARERYASLKRNLLEMPGVEHRSYSDGKASLIQQLLAEALASRHER